MTHNEKKPDAELDCFDIIPNQWDVPYLKGDVKTMHWGLPPDYTILFCPSNY